MKNIDKKFINKLGTYNRQLCSCGHSILFRPDTKYLICNHCGKKIINKTRGHFLREMYGRLNVQDRER